MAQQTINIGTVANDGTGDYIRDAFDKANDNFTELYAGLTGLLDFKGSTDCSANPNYPAASKGDFYLVSVAGKIGGGSGIVVEAGDSYFATADNAGGTQASVGTSWTVIQGNITAYLPLSGGTLTGDLVVPAEVYGGGWNGSNEVPTKNDVYDKIEAVVAGVPGTYTDEMAQDAIGAMIDSSLTYVDGTPLLQVTQANLKPTEQFVIALSDETTAITTGDGKASWFFGYDFTITEIYLALGAAQSSSGVVTVDVNKAGSTILSTKATIGASLNTSLTGSGSVSPVISTATSTKGDKFTADLDAAGTGAKGLKLIIIGHRA